MILFPKRFLFDVFGSTYRTSTVRKNLTLLFFSDARFFHNKFISSPLRCHKKLKIYLPSSFLHYYRYSIYIFEVILEWFIKNSKLCLKILLLLVLHEHQ